LFTDGRDSPPTAAKTYVAELRNMLVKQGVGTIASIMGRYWAMDRDLRWDRTAKAYFALTKGDGHLVKSVEEAIDNSYSEGKTDEFIEPSIITDAGGKPLKTTTLLFSLTSESTGPDSFPVHLYLKILAKQI
jgi:2,3-bisphosphoglycerate-independent phosphoglycerate mutase